MPKIGLYGVLNLVGGVQNVMVRGNFSKIGAKNDEIESFYSDAGVLRSKKSEFGTPSRRF